MRNDLLILTFGLISIQSSPQGNYIEYYILVNQADRVRYEKNYEESLKHYEEGFENVVYIHSINYVKAAKTATELKIYELAKKYN